MCWGLDSHYFHMGVSLNGGTPKSSFLTGFSIINHPFWGTPIFGNTHIVITPIVGVYIPNLKDSYSRWDEFISNIGSLDLGTYEQ